MPKILPRTLVMQDPTIRGKEEFHDYWVKALNTVDQRQLRRMHINMADMVDVFRNVYLQGFMKALVIQLEEINQIEGRTKS